MNLGEKIKMLRLEQDLSLEELGNKVGVGKSTVRKWETGMIENMRRDKIDKLAKALNTTPAFLLGWTETANTTNNYYLSNSEIAHIEKYRAVDDVTKNIVDTILDRETSRPVLMAAHNEHLDEQDEAEKIKSDLAYLKNIKNN